MSEILAPAGNIDALYAAVRTGADAVYLGCGNFNARRNAENFTLEELPKITEYCRVRGVRVYLTLNTLLYNGELDLALKTATVAAKSGADGFICTDLGLCSLIKKALPDMPLHASTQLSVHTPSALYLLKELGFKRVVPAREMSRDELKKLCDVAKEIGLEVEVFVHGALCMSMSGQCLMSAFLGGRSGNRGLCAGTCRLPFLSGESDYALSLKDMSHIKYIKELENMGVTSFKIEGRMKTPEYVSAVTAACKKVRDGEILSEDAERTLADVFSRNGFTNGYFTKRTGKDMFGFRTEQNKNATKQIQNSLHENYRNELPRVALNFKFTCLKGEPVTLSVNDEKHTATVVGALPSEAQNRPLTKESAEISLAKLGGTPYYAERTETDIDDGLFVSAAEINNLRRTAIEKITALRATLPTVKTIDVKIPDRRYEKSTATPETMLYFNDISQLPDNIHDETVIIPAEQLKNMPQNNYKKVVLSFARATASETEQEKVLAALDKKYTLLCENAAHIYLAKKYGFKFLAGTGLNVLNKESQRVLCELGAEKVILSYETKLSELARFSENCGLCVFGKAPLMLTKNCPIKAAKGCENCDGKIIDRKNIEFPVRCRNGFSQIFNSRPIYLADRLDEFCKCPTKVLYFSTETKSEVENIINAYRKKLPPSGEYTRGLYHKGVL